MSGLGTSTSDGSGQSSAVETDGWRLVSELEHWAEGRRLEHWAVHRDGRRVHLDFSPYRALPPQDFERLVRLGMPDRGAVGSIAPLSSEDVERLWGEAVGCITEENGE